MCFLAHELLLPESDVARWCNIEACNATFTQQTQLLAHADHTLRLVGCLNIRLTHENSLQFGLYVFGREVETDGGALGVTATYLVTALGEGHRCRPTSLVHYSIP